MQYSKELHPGMEKPARTGRKKSRVKDFFRRAKLGLCGIAAALAIGASAPKSAKAEDAWLIAYPAYSYGIQNDSHNPNIRILGGGSLPFGITASAAVNAFSPDRNSAEMQFGHSEFRLHRLFGWLGPLVQYELEPWEDTLRAGLAFIPPLGENMSLLVRILSFSVPTQNHGEATNFLDTKLVLFFSASLTESLSMETYWHWVLKERAVWGEAALDYMFTSWLGLGAQVRHNFSFDGPDSTSILVRAVLRM